MQMTTNNLDPAPGLATGSPAPFTSTPSPPPIEIIRPGDRVFFEPGEEHWHGAAATRFMTHIAMLEVDQKDTSATWGEHVTDDEYRAAPAP